MNDATRAGPLTIGLPLVYPLAASVLPIILRVLTPHYDNLSIVFTSFLVGSAGLMAVAWLLYRAELGRTWRNVRLLGMIMSVAVVGFSMNMLYIEGVRQTSAVFAGMMTLLGVPLATGLAALFFADEREGIKSRRFQIGFVLAIGSTLGLTLSRGGAAVGDGSGALYLIGATLCNVTIGLLAKKLTLTGQPVCVIAVICSIETVFFFAASLIWGDLTSLGRAAPEVNALLVFYGVYGLLLTGAVYFVMIQVSGVVVALFAQQLVTPIFTAIFSFFILAEVLSPLQLMCGAILLAGSGLILSQQRRGRARLNLRPEAVAPLAAPRADVTQNTGAG